jgi:hypothetical protein
MCLLSLIAIAPLRSGWVPGFNPAAPLADGSGTGNGEIYGKMRSNAKRLATDSLSRTRCAAEPSTMTSVARGRVL